MLDVLNTLKTGWTPGAVGIYGIGIPILVILAQGLWRGLPAVLEQWTKRADAEAARTEREFSRLEAQIKSSDDRHQACEDRCIRLQGEVERVNKVLDGLLRQMRQMQLSAVRMGAGEPSIIATLINELDHIPGGDFAK